MITDYIESDYLNELLREKFDGRNIRTSLEGAVQDIMDIAHEQAFDQYPDGEEGDAMCDKEMNRAYKSLMGTDVKVRATLSSNYDCVNSFWYQCQEGFGVTATYFGDMVKMLNLCPKEVKELMIAKGHNVGGTWRAKTSQRPSFCTVQEFYTVIRHSPYGASVFAFEFETDLDGLLAIAEAGKVPMDGCPLGMKDIWEGDCFVETGVFAIPEVKKVLPDGRIQYVSQCFVPLVPQDGKKRDYTVPCFDLQIVK